MRSTGRRGRRINNLHQALRKIGLLEEHVAKVEDVRAFVEPLLYYLPRRTKDYTDHAFVHSDNLIEIFQRLLDDLGANTLVEEERYAICLSVFLHDLGCLISRKRHHLFSFRILGHNRFQYIKAKIGSDIFECVKYIAISHASKYNFKRLPQHQIHPRIRLPLVCALFRLVDGCDLMPTRTNPVLYDVLMAYDPLNSESVDVWQAHFSTVGLVFINHHITISSTNRVRSSLLTDHLKEDLTAINGVLQSAPYDFPAFSVDVRKV